MNNLCLYLLVLTLILVLLVYTAPASAQQWRTGYYVQLFAKRLPVSAVPFSKYTHVIQYALLPLYNRGEDACGLDTGFYLIAPNAAEFINTAHANGTKAVISMVNDEAAAAMRTCTDPLHVDQFVETIVTFVNTFGYDGFDIDWESRIITSQYQQWVIKLRAAMPGRLLLIAGGWNQRYMLAQVQDKVDQINIGNYDSDAWPVSGAAPLTTTAYNSALYQGPNTDWITADMIVFYMAVDARIARSKLGIGMPFYARIKSGCLAGHLIGSSCTEGLSAPGQQYASGNAFTNPRNAMNYGDLVNSIYWTNGTRIWDSLHGAQYIQYVNKEGSAFISYTGVEQIREAVSYVKKAGLGGIMTYEFSNEYLTDQSGDARYPLSTAMYNAMAEERVAPVP